MIFKLQLAGSFIRHYVLFLPQLIQIHKATAQRPFSPAALATIAQKRDTTATLDCRRGLFGFRIVGWQSYHN
jgi:hypothetical protein